MGPVDGDVANGRMGIAGDDYTNTDPKKESFARMELPLWAPILRVFISRCQAREDID